jgi:hypothetical protein
MRLPDVVHDIVGVTLYDAHGGLHLVEGLALILRHDQLHGAAAGTEVLGDAPHGLACPEPLGERRRQALDEPAQMITQPGMGLEL